ncbi:WHG domain-containing protein [Streptomyces actinomycinicus]|uniref:WHG domain-containing protein n=1 Tax=Streptomyces actinomycinicus TaxID=1695166 RepID=UPI0027D9F6AF|nr:WHG domain-containing protein [Streptomyces actinomycinicus]
MGSPDEAGLDESGLEAHPAERRQRAADHPAARPALRRALFFWTRLHGIPSLELAGHFAGLGFHPAVLYDTELQQLTRLSATSTSRR